MTGDQARFELVRDFGGSFGRAVQALEIALVERGFDTVPLEGGGSGFQSRRMAGTQVDSLMAAGRVELHPTATGVRLTADFEQIVKIEKILGFVRWLDRLILLGIAGWMYFADLRLFALIPVGALFVNELVFRYVVPRTFQRIEREARSELDRILTAALQAAG